MGVASHPGAPNSSARAFNLLKFALKPEEEEEEEEEEARSHNIGNSHNVDNLVHGEHSQNSVEIGVGSPFLAENRQYL